MSRHTPIGRRPASLLLLLVCLLLPGCRLEGEFDPDIGRKDDDTVYRTPTRTPR